MNDPITITYDPSWRAEYWDDQGFRREAWFVTCADHEYLGRDSDGHPWGYAKSGIAQMVATRHRRAYHQ